MKDIKCYFDGAVDALLKFILFILPICIGIIPVFFGKSMDVNIMRVSLLVSVCDAFYFYGKILTRKEYANRIKIMSFISLIAMTLSIVFEFFAINSESLFWVDYVSVALLTFPIVMLIVECLLAFYYNDITHKDNTGEKNSSPQYQNSHLKVIAGCQN